MRALWALNRRHMKLYFRDKASVFFSLLSVLIVVALYALFLGQTNKDAIRADVGDIPGVGVLVDSWLMGGILAISPITVTLGTLGTLIADRRFGQMDGFLVAPVSRGSVAISYYLSAVAVGVIMSLVGLVAAEAYIASNGGALLSAGSMLSVVGLLLLNVLSASTLTLFLASLVHSQNGYAAMSTIVGVLIGFLTGIYVPIGILPGAVQSLMLCIPATHGASLLRQAFVAQPIQEVFAQAPPGVREEFEVFNGIALKAGETQVPESVMVLTLLLSAVLFGGLSILVMRRKKG